MLNCSALIALNLCLLLTMAHDLYHRPCKLKTKLGHITSDSQVIANTLNQFFTDIGPNIANSITLSSSYSENFLNFPNIKNSLFLSPSPPDELITIISSLTDKNQLQNMITRPNSINSQKFPSPNFSADYFISV